MKNTAFFFPYDIGFFFELFSSQKKSLVGKSASMRTRDLHRPTISSSLFTQYLILLTEWNEVATLFSPLSGFHSFLSIRQPFLASIVELASHTDIQQV